MCAMLWRMPVDLRRERIGMMFINIDASRATARLSSAAGMTHAAGSRLGHGRQMTGGKGGKAGNLTCGCTAHLLGETGKSLAETAETPCQYFGRPAPVTRVSASKVLALRRWSKMDCANCANRLPQLLRVGPAALVAQLALEVLVL